MTKTFTMSELCKNVLLYRIVRDSLFLGNRFYINVFVQGNHFKFIANFIILTILTQLYLHLHPHYSCSNYLQTHYYIAMERVSNERNQSLVMMLITHLESKSITF